MVEHVFDCTARAVRSSPSPSSLWRRARLTGHPMIELPHQFLTAIFAAVIIVANVRRSRNWLRGSPDVHERSSQTVYLRIHAHVVVSYRHTALIVPCPNSY